ncbi:hypothetical protein [Metabacillus fastidiosus]|uniref:hypothetical protein n=1 Tax=Metabacillus fastidiosus TaxID=1458 RepID=UPI003D26786B
MIDHTVPYKVLLPKRLWEEARDKKHLKELILIYMKRYPHYVIRTVKDGFAECERK